jgi:8-oxo-dGTP pyrophosphatase MutT (NUDIX family)
MEKSCGIIPVKYHQGEFLYLLIQHHDGHWGFPKGHMEEGESFLETAVRELEEETGLTLDKIFLKRSFKERYQYHREGHRWSKMVVYYLGFVERGSVKIQDKEIKNHAWLPFEKIIKKLPFIEIKKILLESQQYLGK